MSFFEIILSNKVINATLIAWFIAQALKVTLVLITSKKLDFSRFVGAGGMPSSHAATVCCLMVMVARTCQNGIHSPLFAISFVFAMVTMYDAAGVRHAAGEQAKILNKMIDNWDTKDPDFMNVELKELLGHTPLQVVAGAILGFIVGFLYVV